MTDRDQHLHPTDDASIARGVVVSATSQVGSQIVHMLLNVLSSVVIIRYLSPSVYGDFVLVMVLTSIVALISDFGLNKIGIREVARVVSDEAQIVGTIIVVRLALAGIAALTIQSILLALDRSAEVHTAAAAASIAFIGNALLSVTIAFNVRLQQHLEAFTVLFGEIVETSIVIWLVTHHGSLTQLYVAVAVGASLAGAIAIFLARRRLALRPSFERALVAPLLRGAWSLALASLVGVVLIKLDSFMLAVLRTRREVGLYGAAYAPIEYLAIAALVLVTVLLPLLSRYAFTDQERFVSVYRLGTEALVAFVVPIAILVALLAEPAVDLVYSEKYADAVVPMRLLGLGLVSMTFTAWYATMLLAVNRQQLILRINTVMLVVGLAMHAVLISLFGPSGAATGVVLVGLITGTAAGVLVKRLTHVTLDLGRLARVTLAAACIALVGGGAALVGLDPWLGAFLGAAAYLPALHALDVSPRRLVAVLTEKRAAASESGGDTGLAGAVGGV